MTHRSATAKHGDARQCDGDAGRGVAVAKHWGVKPGMAARRATQDRTLRGTGMAKRGIAPHGRWVAWHGTGKA